MNCYPLLNFSTESFSFKVYSATIEEQQMIQEFKNDDKVAEFLPDFWQYIEETQKDLEAGIEPIRYTTIAYLEQKPIGLITFYNVGNELIFSHGIRPTERGKRLSSKIKREVFDYVFSNLKDIEKITVFIDANNQNNLHSLQKLTYDEIEKILDCSQNKEFFKVSNYNPYLEKSLRDKEK